MKKKMVGICVIMLLLSMIIHVSGVTVEQEKREEKNLPLNLLDEVI